jgi:hypothetical protein
MKCLMSLQVSNLFWNEHTTQFTQTYNGNATMESREFWVLEKQPASVYWVLLLCLSVWTILEFELRASHWVGKPLCQLYILLQSILTTKSMRQEHCSHLARGDTEAQKVAWDSKVVSGHGNSVTWATFSLRIHALVRYGAAYLKPQAGGWCVGGQAGLHSKFQASLGCKYIIYIYIYMYKAKYLLCG